MKSSVALVICKDYQPMSVEKAVAKGLRLLGGVEGLFQSGEKILLKPNLLSADPPEKAVTTHPEVFRAMAAILLKFGVNLCFGDSPAIGSVNKVARVSGIAQVAQELGIATADFKNGETIFCENATHHKKFTIARGLVQCDGMISLAKLKTHGLMKITGAVKNQFGCIPGLLKGEYHLRLSDLDDFARMLVDLNIALKPRLFVIDGIMSMEGNGPRSGKTRQLGFLGFSTDPVALDSTICRLLSINPESVPTVRIGSEAGLGQSQPANIELLGEIPDWAGKIVFALPHRSSDYSRQMKWMRQHVVARPIIDPNLCKNCGICLQSCPLDPSALSWPGDDKDGYPEFDYKRCLHCYCCQELCPEGAVTLYTPWLGRTLDFLRPKAGNKGREF